MSKKNCLLFFVLITGLFSCVGSRKLQQVSAKLSTLHNLQVIENNKILTIDSIGKSKLAERKIDSNINTRLHKRISVLKLKLDSINEEIFTLQGLAVNQKTFRNAYKKEIFPKLAQLDTFYERYVERMKMYLMMEDGVRTANYVLFDQAAFFGPGLYHIPPGQAQLAMQSFLPMADSLVSFLNKYQDIPRTATLVILGFADGQSIIQESNLDDTLSNMIGSGSASKEILNKKLSELRAIELIKELAILFKERIPEIKNASQLNVEYIGQGRGEEFPIPSIKDYKADDERRRIVICYWAVFPNIE